MHWKPQLTRFAALAVLLVLVAAETLAVVHSVDLDAHAGGDPCNVCISVAGLGSAAPAKSAAPEAPRTDLPLATAQDVPQPLELPKRAPARGPPLAS